jgi:hypothetical protein
MWRWARYDAPVQTQDALTAAFADSAGSRRRGPLGCTGVPRGLTGGRLASWLVVRQLATGRPVGRRAGQNLQQHHSPTVVVCHDHRTAPVDVSMLCWRSIGSSGSGRGVGGNHR